MPDLSATLSGIKERAAHADRVLKSGGNFSEAAARSQRDVPSLVAAVEAVLKFHTRRLVKTRNICAAHGPFGDDEGYSAACPDCTITEHYTCASCRHICPDDDEWPCENVRAIQH
jgi:hypothetical protein